jgi:hypothetical protein
MATTYGSGILYPEKSSPVTQVCFLFDHSSGGAAMGSLTTKSYPVMIFESSPQISGLEAVVVLVERDDVPCRRPLLLLAVAFPPIFRQIGLPALSNKKPSCNPCLWLPGHP